MVSVCEVCSAHFEAKDFGRPRRFCSDRCRQAASRARKAGEAPVTSAVDWDQQEHDELMRQARALTGGSYPVAGSVQTSADVEYNRLAAGVKASMAPGGVVGAGALVDWLRTGEQRKALVSDATGGILLPSDLVADIATVARDAGTIRSLASVRPTDEGTHRAGLLSAATVGWGKLETGTSATDAAISVSSPALDIAVHDVMALALVGVDELADSLEAARAAIVEAIGIAIGEAEDAAFAAGTGTGQPKGLALAANVSRVPAGQKTAAGASATPVTADVLGLPWKLPVRYRRGAVWLASTDMAPKLAALTYTNGDALMPNPGQNIGPGGWPFYELPGLPSAATAGTTDPSVWFVNLQAAYRVVDHRPHEITVQRLGQRYVDQGYIGVLVRRRVGGDLVRPDAAAIYTL